jgi:hypothetical protein
MLEFLRGFMCSADECEEATRRKRSRGADFEMNGQPTAIRSEEDYADVLMDLDNTDAPSSAVGTSRSVKMALHEDPSVPLAKPGGAAHCKAASVCDGNGQMNVDEEDVSMQCQSGGSSPGAGVDRNGSPLLEDEPSEKENRRQSLRGSPSKQDDSIPLARRKEPHRTETVRSKAKGGKIASKRKDVVDRGNLQHTVGKEAD